MARKTNVVVKWGVAQVSTGGVALWTHSSREEARATYKANKSLGFNVKRPFKIYVEV